MRWTAIAAVLLLTGVVTSRLVGAEAGASSESVTLKERPALRPGMDSFPRVVSNAAVTPGVAAKINASLARFENEVLTDARECRKQRAGQEDADDWQRTVTVTMRGPRYLSLLAEETYSCGAPHPLDDRLALVYDLTTGSPVDWTRLLPAGAKGEIVRSPHRLAVGLVVWPLIVKKEQDAAEEECKAVFEREKDDMSYDVWLDGAQGAVIFGPVGLVHYDSAMCGDPVALSGAEARRLGAAPELVDALDAAKQAK